jgi:hypothetical protein
MQLWSVTVVAKYFNSETFSKNLFMHLYVMTSLLFDPSELKEMKLFSVEPKERLLKPNSCQTHESKIDRLTSDSRQTQTSPDPTIGATQPCLYFLLPQSPPSKINFNFFRFARTALSSCQAWRTLAIILGVDFVLHSDDETQAYTLFTAR